MDPFLVDMAARPECNLPGCRKLSTVAVAILGPASSFCRYTRKAEPP